MSKLSNAHPVLGSTTFISVKIVLSGNIQFGRELKIIMNLTTKFLFFAKDQQAPKMTNRIDF